MSLVDLANLLDSFRERKLMRALTTAICVFLGACLLCAQSRQGSIAGTIVDRIGHKVASAPIEAKNMTTGAAYATQSDAQGAYAFSLPSGGIDVILALP